MTGESPARRNVSTLLAVVALLVTVMGVAVAFDSRAGRSEESAPPGQRFFTVPPGTQLASGDVCAGLVKSSPREPRPGNTAANQTRGYRINHIDGADETAQAHFAPRVDGNYVGTTDEVIQWGACKWGFDEDIVRAVATAESYWDQNHIGDEGHSFGLLQVKCSVHKEACPGGQMSTAFNLDYALAWRRSCFEGYFSHWVPDEARGDEWGCIGLWYSGDWKEGDESYVSKVSRYLEDRPWMDEDF